MTAIHLRVLSAVAPRQQVMFRKPDGRWFVWTGESRNPRNPNNYRPMRRWSPIDWGHRARQFLFGWWWFGVEEPRLIAKLKAYDNGSETPRIIGYRCGKNPDGGVIPLASYTDPCGHDTPVWSDGHEGDRDDGRSGDPR